MDGRIPREPLSESGGRAGAFALAGQGARSVVGLLPMSEEQRRPVGAKARPLRGFVLEGASAVFPGLTVERLRRCAGRLASAPSRIETRSARFVQRFPRRDLCPSEVVHGCLDSTAGMGDAGNG